MGQRLPSAPLRALLPYLRPYRGVLLLALLALLVASAAMLSLPVALRYLIDYDPHLMLEGIVIARAARSRIASHARPRINSRVAIQEPPTAATHRSAR